MPKIIPITCENKFSYNIIINDNFENLVRNINSIKSEKYDKICVFTDSNVAKAYIDDIVDRLSAEYNIVITYIMEPGEENKQLSVVEGLYEHLIGNHFTRKDLLIALGGGVVGDMCGFAAATYLRGIDFIQIPTTLLSQVDSSIGGKTGVDYLSYKNMIGAFHMPRLVYINLETLNSLPREQLSCGMGEVIKYGMIMDRDFYSWLASDGKKLDDLSREDIFHIVETSILCKKQVVEEDPREHGIRAHLNFGHTIGHAIEKLCDFKLYHGQCVAIGMVAALYLSMKSEADSGISDTDISDLRRILDIYGLYDCVPTEFSSLKASDIIDAMKSDKKADAGRIKFVILKEVGKADTYMDFNDSDYMAAINKVLP
ncbi:MAG: 3-dehydroquinate synthase [Lachnospiraceae bacterium]|nr:3-dehydroquinate synthase [Lachnospiraceae bacterium]